MNILINIFKENISENSHLYFAYLFNYWLYLIHSEDRKSFTKQKLPTVEETKKALNLSDRTIKSAKEELISNHLLNVEGKQKYQIYNLSLHTVDGDLVELNDPTAFDGSSKCSAQWNAFGNYISIDNEFISSDLSSKEKEYFILAKWLWMNHDGETQFHIGYNTDFERNGFHISQSSGRKLMNQLVEKGFIKKDTVCNKFGKGYERIKLSIKGDLNAVIKNEKEIDETINNIHTKVEDIENKLKELPDTYEEIKNMISNNTKEIKENTKEIKNKIIENKEIIKEVEEICDDEFGYFFSQLDENGLYEGQKETTQVENQTKKKIFDSDSLVNLVHREEFIQEIKNEGLSEKNHRSYQWNSEEKDYYQELIKSNKDNKEKLVEIIIEVLNKGRTAVVGLDEVFYNIVMKFIQNKLIPLDKVSDKYWKGQIRNYL